MFLAAESIFGLSWAIARGAIKLTASAAVVRSVVEGIDDVYQLAADMGGAGYIFTGEHDAAVMHNSATINLNTLEFGVQAGVRPER